MSTENTEKKKIYSTSYSSLIELERAVMRIEKRRPLDLRITVMGIVCKICLEENNGDLNNGPELQDYWNVLLKNHPKLGMFDNAELGKTFIVGTLASAFMNEINGKTLGTLSVGPYAVIRGMGATEGQAETLVKFLKERKYLILFRGVENELEKYKHILEDLD